MTFSDLERITGGKLLRLSSDGPVKKLLTDSRKAFPSPGAVFFAIAGKHHDGHQYIPTLYRSGLRWFVVENEFGVQAGIDLPEASILSVASCVDALQRMARERRLGFSNPVIGIAGSNGKTIIKEWLYQLLSPGFSIAKNPGSYNSQIGVPLSVWNLEEHHDLGIFEAGISRPGEMEKLERIIQPDIGIFTNIGPAHDEGFTGQEQKIREKLTLFRNSKTILYCRDHEPIHRELREKENTLSWGFSSAAHILVARENENFQVRFGNIRFELLLPFSDPASQENCFHCVALMLHLGLSPETIRDRITTLRSVPMRLELKEGINRSQVIDDTYNNDLGGLQISLDFLRNQSQKNKKRIILSDILESGLPEEELVKKIAALVSSARLHHFTGVGKILSKHKHHFPLPADFYESTEEFLDAFRAEAIENEIILIKGARTFQFERIVHQLQRKVHGTVMEIDLGAVAHNLNFFRARLHPETRLMVMVKAFAYGSGSTEIANLLQYHKVDYLGVAYADEGIELRKNNITLPILVMNPSEESFKSLIDYSLEPEVYSFKLLHQLIHFLNGKPCTIHIKLDTGMHRLGFIPSEIPELSGLLRKHTNLEIASVFSHLAGADEPAHDAFSRQQADLFRYMADELCKALPGKPLRHILNSPGILRLPELQFDMVRLGIGLYGIDPTVNPEGGLKPVATLRTIISQVRQIPEGDSIGYGRKGKAEKPLTLATIAIGYADGYSRAFSRGVGFVLVHGRPAPVVGNVCMDMTMVDITGIPAREGDEVIVFGNDLPIQVLASRIQTIPYEILTNTSERVKRVFVAESI